MKRLLITSFEPFGDVKTNSSSEVVKKIDHIENFEVIKEQLPVVYDQKIYEELLDKYHPDYMLLCGQAGGRNLIDMEQVAINMMFSPAPDNLGNIRKGEKIFEDGPDAYFSNIEVLKIVGMLQEEKLPIRLSLSAGAYICNLGFYSTMYYIKKKNLNTKVVFIHFPFFNGQITDNKYPTLDLDSMVNVLEKIILSL
jgi:pyroglutamyl-peptidase